MKSASRQKLSSGEKLKDVLKQNRRLGSGGVYSVCSAHPWVLEAVTIVFSPFCVPNTQQVADELV
jgi:hypothetical protein